MVCREFFQSESDFVTRFFAVQYFFLAIAFEGRQGRFDTGEHILYRALSGNILDITPGEGVFVCEHSCILFRKVRNHGLPDLGAGVLLWQLKLDLEDETALEGRVKVGKEVGGGNKDAFDVLHLFQDEVLDGIVHLVHTLLYILDTLSKDSIRFVEKQDGSLL